MKVDMIRILDGDGELVEVFIAVLLARTRRTVIPELYEVFGPEQVMRFLDLFAGTRIEVPSRDVISQAPRDADIYATLAAHKTPSGAWQENTG
jgi:hypothetical protein